MELDDWRWSALLRCGWIAAVVLGVRLSQPRVRAMGLIQKGLDGVRDPRG